MVTERPDFFFFNNFFYEIKKKESRGKKVGFNFDIITFNSSLSGKQMLSFFLSALVHSKSDRVEPVRIPKVLPQTLVNSSNTH